VALVKVNFWRVEEPLAVMLVVEAVTMLAVVAKKLVVVAEVPVALVKVTFCKVEEAVTKRLVVVAWVAVRLAMVPTDVRDDETTFAARVVPVSVPAGAVPVMFPVKLPVTFPVA